MRSKELWLVEKNRAAVKPDSSIALVEWKLTAKGESNCVIYKLEKSSQFLCGLHEVYSHIMASSDLFICPRESSSCHVVWRRSHFGCKRGL